MSDSPSRTVWVTYYAPASSVIRECGNSLLLRVRDGRTFFHPRKLCRLSDGMCEIVAPSTWEWRLSRKRHGYDGYETETVGREEFSELLRDSGYEKHEPEPLDPEPCDALEELLDDGTD